MALEAESWEIILKLWIAGNFEFFNQPEKEKKFLRFCEKELGGYNRLGSFFFETETGKLLKAIREVENEDKNRGVPGGRRKLATRN